MPDIWVTTDLHLYSRDNDARHPYRSIQNIGVLSDQFAEEIQEDDILIFLGDLCDPDATDKDKIKAVLDYIPCRKLMCRGNHDIADDEYYLSAGFDEVADVIRLYNIVFSHKPLKVDIDEINIHGHLHTAKLVTMGYNHINAYAALHDKQDKPIRLDELLNSAVAQDYEYTKREQRLVSEEFENYTTLEGDAHYYNILDISDWFKAYPVDEVTITIPGVLFKTPQDLSQWMKKHIKYANYSLLKRPEETIDSQSGSCHDQVAMEYMLLKNMGISPHILYLMAYKEGSKKGGMTHSLIYYQDKKGKIHWFENAWQGHQGIHTFDSVEDMKKYITDQYGKLSESKRFPKLFFKKIPFSVFSSTYGKPLGSFVDTVMAESVMSPNEPGKLDEILFLDVDDTKYWLADDNEYRDDVERAEANKKSNAAIDEGSNGVYPIVTATATKSTNPNDTVSQEAVDLKFYNEEKKHIGEASISSVDTPTGFLYNVEVYPKYRGMGYGNAIVDYVLKHYSVNELTVEKGNAIAISMYEKFGFERGISFRENGKNMIDMKRPLRQRKTKPTINEGTYDPPLDYDKLPAHLRDDPVHVWRAKTGIELIHKEPTVEELDRIWANWQLMPDNMKRTSDRKSMELYKMTNAEHYEALFREYINETPLASTLEKDHEQNGKKSLSSFKMIHLSESDRKKYIADGHKFLKHFYADGEDGHKTLAWLDKGKLVGAVSVAYPDTMGTGNNDKWNGHNWIESLEITPEYRGYGLSKQILDVACKRLGANALGVAEDNEIAKALYRNYGFKGRKKNGTNYIMYLKEDSGGLYAKKSSDDIAEKYGLRDVGRTHDAEELEQKNREKREEEREERKKEAKIERKRKQKERILAKARRVQKRTRMIRKIKSHLPGSHNEDADAVDGTDASYLDMPYTEYDVQRGERAPFFNNFRDYEGAETSLDENFHCLEMIDNVQFFDNMNEAAADDNDPAAVFVALIYGDSPLSAVIRGATGAEFTHASISFDSSMTKLFSFGEKKATNKISAIIGGFREESFKDPYYTKHNIPYAIYCVPTIKGAVKKMKKRLEYFSKNRTKFHFNHIGLVTAFFNIATDDPPNRRFCSQFVADILNAGNPDKKLIAEPSLCRPEDFKTVDFAVLVDKGFAPNYDRRVVDKKTKAILRSKKLSESIDIPLDNPYAYDVLSYQLSVMSETAVDEFIGYLKSFKIRFDKEGNIVVTRREYDQLEMHFRSSLKLIKACEAAGDVNGVKEELYKIHYMIELINQYYLQPGVKNMKPNTKEVRKDMMDLRSVMMNAFQQHLKYVVTRDPKWNFQSGYAVSKYGKDFTIPQKVITSIGKSVVTALI